MLYLRRYSETNLWDGAQMTNFCVLYFSELRAAHFRPAFLIRTKGHIMCGSMVDIQSATAENEREKKEEEETQLQNTMSASATQGGHKKLLRTVAYKAMCVVCDIKPAPPPPTPPQPPRPKPFDRFSIYQPSVCRQGQYQIFRDNNAVKY